MKNDSTLLQYAARNIRLFPLSKVFTKRVFVPLMAVYFMEVAGFSLKDIGVLATFYAFISLLVEVPTGYFADKWSRVVSIRIGSALLAIATLFYVFMPMRIGIFGAQLVEALGYGFISGASEAMVHDSLIVLGKTSQYAKTMGRAQSISLIINAVLVALIPMTYVIDKRIPFLIGTLVFTIFFVFTFFLHEMPKYSDKVVRTPITMLWFRENKRLVLWFSLLGLMAALYWSPTDFTNLTLKEFGLRPELLGWVFSFSSILGAFGGIYFHKLRGLKPYQYAILDTAIMALPLLSVVFHSMIILAVTTVISLAFWRYRRIIYQDRLLSKYKPNYKATLLSAMNNAEQLNQVWLPLFVAFLVVQFGLSGGLLTLGLLSLGLAPIFVFQTKKLLG